MIGFVFFNDLCKDLSASIFQQEHHSGRRLAKIMKFIYKSKPQDLFLHRTEKCEKV